MANRERERPECVTHSGRSRSRFAFAALRLVADGFGAKVQRVSPCPEGSPREWVAGTGPGLCRLLPRPRPDLGPRHQLDTRHALPDEVDEARPRRAALGPERRAATLHGRRSPRTGR